ncbi:MAG TPA: transposase [Ideonella sp.]|uniref:transposase n=1 Tax=Ideonella sp. TaxID=1929293 RepID=UPI002CA6DCC5|nr:transposase [Ideonella sp.]HSI49182.1 transposase [Ideonella sp.]
MELVTRLAKDGQRVLAIGIGSLEARNGYELDQLGLNGLPDPSDARRRAEASFNEWDSASIAEYAGAFGLAVPKGHAHAVWAFQYNRIRFVVPALVLMRALFRPNHHVLPMLFRPQSLEDACTYAGPGPHGHIALLGSFRGSYHARERTSIAEPLSWMYCFPSARAMWASAFGASQEGRLDLKLPQASARMVLHGRMHAQNFYATRLSFVSVTANEEPFEFASDHSRTICFHVMDEAMASGFKRNKTQDKSIGLRDGEHALSDEEWQEVEPIVVRGGPGFKHAPRAVVDAVLAKQCQGTSWTETTYPPGIQHTTACVAFCRWQKDGRWADVLRTLARFRGPP